MSPTETATRYATSGLRALTDIAWMGRRHASTPAGAEQAGAFNEANWLLHKMARREHLNLGHPDRTANRDYDAPGIVETPSFFTDGASVDFEPSPERQADLADLSAEDAVQWMVEVIHPLAHQYADGRATYASSMFNDATRTLRAAGFDLSPTEALGRSVWVMDGMGDSYARLSPAEVAERDSARGATPNPDA